MADPSSDELPGDRLVAGSSHDVVQRLRLVHSRGDSRLEELSSLGIAENDILAILNERRRRSKFFPEELFADPAWDILLELYAAHLGQRQIDTTSLCIGSAVPSTTALRWIVHLERRGLVARSDDPLDGRRSFVQLTAEGLNAVERYFDHPQFSAVRVI
jgi:DNA-binding MarR family transcriptional regulator